ncbi:MAG: HAMP domain-containing histidine kinase [Ramlibacter sp.]|nr:HAMP domain-containing histidine kinase [Ramlibacter sp.]
MSRLSLSDNQHALFAPLEVVKDQSRLKSWVFAFALVFGHPLYHWAWSTLSPQPYESLGWRLIAAGLGVVALLAMHRYGIEDRRAAIAYGIGAAFGTVVLSAWFYVANGGNAVWLASLVALTMLYYTLTDWRLATVVTALAFAVAYVCVPMLQVGVWANGMQHQVFDVSAWLILGFTIAMSILTRYTDLSMQAVRMRSQLGALGITAHEVRTPLASLQLLSQGLRDRLYSLRAEKAVSAELEDIKELADDVVRFCEHAHALIETQLANANPFKPFAERAPVRLGDVAQSAVATFVRGRGTRAPLAIVTVKKDFSIDAEPGALQQMLVNLLNNALKAVVLRHGTTVPGQINVSVDYEGLGQITVSDSGCGMTKAELARIFDPFYTGDPKLGHGLGLTFVQSVVIGYGGSISVTSVDGQGTSFSISFPKATPV